MLFIISATLLFVLLQKNVDSLELDQRVIYSLDEAPLLFEQFIEEHNRKYDDKEKKERFKIFVDNLKRINSLNEKSSNAVYGINKFSDLSIEEFVKFYTGLNTKLSSWSRDDQRTDVARSFNNTAPDAFDWRSKGVVSSVKNQSSVCGSSWAFSACGNVESINAIKTGRIIDVSEQQLVDCDNTSIGCRGGLAWNALSYFVHHGAMSSSSYPYAAVDQNCRYDSSKVVIRLKSYKLILNITEDEIKEHLYNIGPLSIAIEALVVGKYSGGIIHDEDCKYSNGIVHTVLLVGYGEENGLKYWSIKNSWGPDWGEKGYFRIQRGNNCLSMTAYGITTAVI